MPGSQPQFGQAPQQMPGSQPQFGQPQQARPQGMPGSQPQFGQPQQARPQGMPGSEPQFGQAPQQMPGSQPQFGQPQKGPAMQYQQSQTQSPVSSQYSSQPVSSGPSQPDEPKKGLGKGAVIGIISAAVLIIAAVVLIFVFDVFGLKGGKPEAVVEKFMKSFSELDANGIMECMAPELKDHMEDIGLGEMSGSAEDIQSTFEQLKVFGIQFNDMKIEDPVKMDVDDAKKKVNDEIGVKIEAKEAAEVKASMTMHMEFMGESMDETMNMDFIVVKQGSKWYIAYIDEEESDEPDITTTEDETEATTEETTEAATEATTEAVTETTTEATTEEITGTVTGGGTLAEYDIKTDNNEQEWYDFITGTGVDPYAEGKAKGALLNYTTEQLSPEILDFAEENDMDLDGYVKKTAEFQIDFNDTDVFTNDDKINYYIWVEDYYDDEFFNDTCEDKIDSYGESYRRYKIKYNDEEKYVYQWITFESNEDSGYWIAKATVTLLVPEGYDGMVAGFSSSNIDPSNAYIWDNYEKDKFFLYRLD